MRSRVDKAQTRGGGLNSTRSGAVSPVALGMEPGLHVRLLLWGRGSQRPVRYLIFQEVAHAFLGERASRKVRSFREGSPSLLYWLFTSLNRGILFCPVPFFYLVEKKDFRVMSIPQGRNSLIFQRGQETLFVEQSGA